MPFILVPVPPVPASVLSVSAAAIPVALGGPPCVFPVLHTLLHAGKQRKAPHKLVEERPFSQGEMCQWVLWDKLGKRPHVSKA